MVPTASDVLDGVDGILTLVRERAPETERAGRLPDDVVTALRGTGINRLMLPTELGGVDASVAEVSTIFERVATADGSTGWCACIGSATNAFSAYMSEAGAREAFADPDQANAAMFAPLGMLVSEDGRTTLRGRWPFASNCLHSAWIGVGAFVQAPDGSVEPVPRIVFVPAGEITIEDTWYSLGLRGTGSHHVSTDGVDVDLRYSASFADRPWANEPRWQIPLFSVLLPLLVAAPLGMARGALDEVARQVREGRAAMRGQLADDPVSIAEFAVADASLRGARAAVHDAVAEAEALAQRGDAVPRALQARVVLACTHACDVAVEATSVAHRLGGGAAAYADSVLPRSLRDVETARQHIAFSHQHRVAAGQALAGLDVAAPPFIV